MKYLLMILAVSLTACTATLKTTETERSWDSERNVLTDDRPAPVITQEDLENLNPLLLTVPLLLAVAWMTFAYMRERKS